MPSKKGDELLAHLEDLCSEHGIKFFRDIDPSQWPTCHKNALGNAKLLGSKSYDTYATATGISESEPWKAEVKSKALLLVQKARRLSKRNESTWRYACEPIVLGRLESEVCCKMCRKRLWRSDVEIRREGDSAAARRLQHRQQAREPCRCPRVGRSQDHLEADGLNQIFNCRVDEEVHHEKDIADRLEKGERPDRVYGLRQTRNIENLLYDAAKRQFQGTSAVERQVYELLGLDQPLRQTGDRILFPFLVLEAKSADSSSGWHSIEMQTAFSIRTFLETQNLLRNAAGRHSKWQSGPLVWFLANKGEEWRLYAAYIQPTPTTVNNIGTHEYASHVVNLWRGSIDLNSGALQLLLLVDYIFDWARDVYREDIIRELRVLATGHNDAASVFYTDPDIFSALPPDISDQPIGESSREVDEARASISAQETFTAIDTPKSIIRHASLVESKYCCIFITRDNVQTLLQSIEQPKLSDLCKKILTHMQTASLISLSALDAIEQQWTGCERLPSHQLAEAKFYTVMSYTTYISSSWHLIRELFTVAIAKDAWLDITVASNLKPNRGKTKTPEIVGELDEADLLSIIQRLQAGSPRQVLHAAISRRAVTIGKNNFGRLDLKVDDGELRRIVHCVYVYFKRGNLEPRDPFLRFTQRLDQQHLLNCDIEPFFDDIAHASKDGCVLLTATYHPTYDPTRSKSEFCAYLTSGEPELPSQPELAAIVVNAFETRDFYHTTRGHWSSTLSPFKKSEPTYRQAWNIVNTYGVYSRGFGFLSFLHAIGSRVPITQGSSRDPDEDGSQLYARIFAPWADPSYIYVDRKERMFVLYRLFSREIRFWRAIAKERIEQGLSCCECCSAMGDHDICDACENFLGDPDRYTWFKDCLWGEEPFEVLPLEGKELGERVKRNQNHDLALREYIWNGRYDGPTDDDGDWAWNLDFYSELEKPFDDVVELSEQLSGYLKFCRDWHPWRQHKRKRDQDSDDGSSREPNKDDDDTQETLDDFGLGEELGDDGSGDVELESGSGDVESESGSGDVESGSGSGDVESERS